MTDAAEAHYIQTIRAIGSLSPEAKQRYEEIQEDLISTEAPAQGAVGVLTQISALNLLLGSRNGKHIDDEIYDALTAAGVEVYKAPQQVALA